MPQNNRSTHYLVQISINNIAHNFQKLRFFSTFPILVSRKHDVLLFALTSTTTYFQNTLATRIFEIILSIDLVLVIRTNIKYVIAKSHSNSRVNNNFWKNYSKSPKKAKQHESCVKFYSPISLRYQDG